MARAISYLSRLGVLSARLEDDSAAAKDRPGNALLPVHGPESTLETGSFPGSSMVERSAVNRNVRGSSPRRGATPF